MISQLGIRQLTLVLAMYASLSFQFSVVAAEALIGNDDTLISPTAAADYKEFYASDRLLRIGLAFTVAGIAANTNVDSSIQNHYQDNIRSAKTNSWSKSAQPGPTLHAKTLGEGKYLLPISLLADGVNLIDNETAIGNRGATASRVYITGLSLMWLGQVATGGSRPDETAHGSNWRPFKDDNGISSHAFVGAVPFLTIAYLNPDNDLIKYSAYIASTATAWSRFNNNDHFPSQIFLGWYLA